MGCVAQTLFMHIYQTKGELIDMATLYVVFIFFFFFLSMRTGTNKSNQIFKCNNLHSSNLIETDIHKSNGRD